MMNVAILKGKVLASIKNNDDEELVFTTDTGEVYKLFHYQDCCERVRIEDIIGTLDDLIGSPLLMAEEVSNSVEPIINDSDSYTWTFYKFATIKGYVTIRWLGVSNGYYSESVDFCQIT